MTKTEYLAYLKSPRWQQMRRTLARSASAQCFCCERIPRSGWSLDLHHLTYERLGNELPTDVVPLCRSCHDIVHEMQKPNEPPEVTIYRLREILGRKRLWNARAYVETRPKPPPHIVTAVSAPVSKRNRPVHPGSVTTTLRAQAIARKARAQAAEVARREAARLMAKSVVDQERAQIRENRIAGRRARLQAHTLIMTEADLVALNLKPKDRP